MQTKRYTIHVLKVAEERTVCASFVDKSTSSLTWEIEMNNTKQMVILNESA